MTPALAEIYGIPSGSLPAPDADGFSQVELDPAERAGLLTRLGFLAWKGTESQPDTILRGVFLNRKIICQALGDPPDEAAGAMLGDEKTNRETAWTTASNPSSWRWVRSRMSRSSVGSSGSGPTNVQAR